MKKARFAILFLILFTLIKSQNQSIVSMKPTANVFTNIGANFSVNGSTAWGDYDQDGDLDVVISGYDYADYLTKIYRNDSGLFTDIGLNLQGALKGSVAWGDFDNDNDLDILLTGESDSTNITKILRNDSGNFVDINTNINGYYNSDAAWGDYDQDGDLDIAIAGTSSSYQTNIFRNQNNLFINSSQLIGVSHGNVAWGDYDNDNDLDLAIAGYNGDQGTEIYRNDNDSFDSLSLELFQVLDGSVEWGDVDNDGDLDLLLNGGKDGYPPYIVIYENSNGRFSNHFIGVNGTSYGNATLGDYDNDGDLDIVIMGEPTPMKIYRNEGNFVYSDISVSLTELRQGNVTWGDYNNDGKLDILATGYTLSYPMTLIYQNDSDIITNTVPTAPDGLIAYPKENSVILAWDTATDNQTPSKSLTYNLRIGTTPGGYDVLSPMSNLTNGYRFIPQSGNMDFKTKITFDGLKSNQEYYWNVQAVDSAFSGSLFSDEQNFSTARIINISAPETGWINTPYSIEATVTFNPPTYPITFTWATTDQMQIVNSRNSLEDSLIYTWSDTGTKTIIITADDGTYITHQIHDIYIAIPSYLPMILKYSPLTLN